jgi:hypothetical protein
LIEPSQFSGIFLAYTVTSAAGEGLRAFDFENSGQCQTVGGAAPETDDRSRILRGRRQPTRVDAASAAKAVSLEGAD